MWPARSCAPRGRTASVWRGTVPLALENRLRLLELFPGYDSHLHLCSLTEAVPSLQRGGGVDMLYLLFLEGEKEGIFAYSPNASNRVSDTEQRGGFGSEGVRA